MIFFKDKREHRPPPINTDPTGIFKRKEQLASTMDYMANQERKCDHTIELDVGFTTHFNTRRWESILLDDDDMVSDSAFRQTAQDTLSGWFRPEIW